MRHILFPWMPTPEPTIPLMKWSQFVDFAARASMYLTLLGTTLFVKCKWPLLDRRRSPAVPPTHSRIATVVPPFLAGWMAAGICEWRWPKFFGAVTTAGPTLTWIGIWTGLWTAILGSVTSWVLSWWLARYLAKGSTLAVGSENIESSQIQRKESWPPSGRK